MKQRRRRRLWERHLKSEFTLPGIFSRLFHLVQFAKCWQYLFWSWILKDCIKVQEKESYCLLFPSATKRKIRKFHIVVVQRRQRNHFKTASLKTQCEKPVEWSTVVNDLAWAQLPQYLIEEGSVEMFGVDTDPRCTRSLSWHHNVINQGRWLVFRHDDGLIQCLVQIVFRFSFEAGIITGSALGSTS